MQLHRRLTVSPTSIMHLRRHSTPNCVSLLQTVEEKLKKRLEKPDAKVEE